MQPYTNWNHDMLAGMNEALKPRWTRLENDIEEKLESFARDINIVIVHIMKRLTSQYHLNLCTNALLTCAESKAPQLLVDTVRTQRTDILHQLQEASLKLQKDVK